MSAGAAQEVAQAGFEVLVAEGVGGRGETGRLDALTRGGQFGYAFAAEQESGAEAGDRKDRGAVQDAGQGAGVVAVANRLGGNGIHRTGQVRVPECPVVDVDQVVDADPGQPLAAVADRATEPGGEQRA